MSSYENFKRSAVPGFFSVIFSIVVGLITTTPFGIVVSTTKSVNRLPKSVARIRSPSIIGSPSSRFPMYLLSRSRLTVVIGVGQHYLQDAMVSSLPLPSHRGLHGHSR